MGRGTSFPCGTRRNRGLMLIVDCVWFYVVSLDEARRFYEGILRLHVVLEDRESGWMEFAADDGGCRLACQEWGRTEESVGAPWPDRTGLDVPRVVLASRDVDHVAEIVRVHGFQVGAPQSIGTVRFVNLRDPDGNALQIVEKMRRGTEP